MVGRIAWFVVVAFLAASYIPLPAQAKAEKGKAAKPAAATKAPAGAKDDGEAPAEGAAAPAPAPGAGVDGNPAGEVEPQFKNSKGLDTYKKGRDLFDLEKYSEAQKEMVRAKDLVKGPQDKILMEGWVKACQGGVALDSYRKLMEMGKGRQAFFQAMDFSESCKGTAVYPRFEVFLEELRTRVVVVLDNFDEVSPRFSTKQGKTFVDDPAIVFKGSHCILWTSLKDGKATQLPLKADRVPKDWSPFYSIVFWIRMEQPTELKLIALNPESPKQDKNQDRDAMEGIYVPSNPQKWVRAEIPLEQFRKHSGGSFKNVEKFVFQVDSKSAFKLYLDEICLIRKDGPKADGKTEEKSAPQKAGSKKTTKTSPGKAKQTERKQSP